MRSMNVKKLAALGLAAAVVGAPLAHAEINTANLPTDKDWYKDAAVVVGTTAQYDAKISDGVWAGNIAAVIANMAYVSQETKTVEADVNDVTVKLSVPGTVTVGGVGYTDTQNYDYDNAEYASPSSNEKEYDHAKVESLKDSETLELDYKEGNASSYDDAEAEVTETLYTKLDVQVDALDGEDTQEVRVVAKNDGSTYGYGIGYKMEIADLFGDELTYPSSGTRTYDLRNFKISVLGKEYEITQIKVDTSRPTEVKMVSSQQTVTLGEGDTTNFEGYTIKLVSVGKSGDTGKAYLQLLDDQGNVVAEDLVDEGDSTDFDGTLSTDVKVDSVFESESGSFAKLKLSSEEKTFTVGTSLGSNAEDIDGYDGWKMEFVWDSSNNELELHVYYEGDDDDTYLDFEHGAEVGDTIQYPFGEYAIKIVGFENKATKDFKVEGSKITFLDKDGQSHEAKLWYYKSSVSSNKFTISNFMDGQSAEFEFSDPDNASLTTSNVSVTFGDSSTNQLSDVEETSVLTMNADIDGDGTNENLRIAVLEFKDGYEYAVAYTLDGSGNMKSAYVYFLGSQDNDSSFTLSEDVPYVVYMDGEDDDGTGDIGAADLLSSNVTVGTSETTVYDGTVYRLTAKTTSDTGSTGNDDKATLYVYDKTVSTSTPVVTCSNALDEGSGTAKSAVCGPFTVMISSSDSTDDQVTVTDVYPSGPLGWYLKERGMGDEAFYFGPDYEDIDSFSDYGDIEFDFGDGGSDVQVDPDYDGTFEETLDADGSNDETHPENTWTEYGTELKVSGSTTIEAEVPKERREFAIFVGKPETTEEGATAYTAKKGETVQIGDYEVTVEDVEVPSATVTYTEAVVEPVGTMVYMDNDVPAKNLIVVGSWYVNNVAKAIADANQDLYDKIKGEGDWVVDKYTYNGKDAIMVAGYTAEDTGAAAQAFINFLKENLG